MRLRGGTLGCDELCRLVRARCAEPAAAADGVRALRAHLVRVVERDAGSQWDDVEAALLDLSRALRRCRRAVRRAFVAVEELGLYSEASTCAYPRVN